MDSLVQGFCVTYEPGSPGVGIVGTAVPVNQVYADTYLNINNNIRSKSDCNSTPVLNVQQSTVGSGVLLNNWSVNQTDRGQINPVNKLQINLNAPNKQWNDLSFLDGPRVTTKETTDYAYAGNAQRQADGTKFYTYEDAPRVTTRETTEYAYTGNASAQVVSEENRFQYVGGQREVDGRMVREGGADTYALRGMTLVENYMNGPGRSNLLSDPEDRLGKLDTIPAREQSRGPGSLQEALPDASRYQFDYIIGKIHPNPNKLINVDDRQIAHYQVTALQSNPLSIYTNHSDGQVPSFECMIEPQNYSPMVDKAVQLPGTQGERWGNGDVVTGYRDYRNGAVNSNSDFVYQRQIDSDGTNKMLEGKAVSTDSFGVGKCYSGDAQVSEYGPTSSLDQYYSNMAQGIYNQKLQQEQAGVNPSAVCRPNPALSFLGTNSLQYF